MSILQNSQDRYQNFNVAIYCTAYDVQKMADLTWLEQRFDVISRYVKVDKVYLETHRDENIAPEATMVQAKQFFADRGVKTSGGITYTVNERNRFQTYCYTDPEHRQKVREIAEYTARLFDEFILDDFFFTNCKCEQCVTAKGNRSWTEFRLAQMTEAAQNLVIGPAKAVNPDVKVTIKYPNWYEHFQGLGFNLETEPLLFDSIYTGTETRDAVRSNQHLQAYQGYSIVRYFENIKPGHNDGGWVDPFGSFFLDRYAEQLWLTLFARAPEITLFHFGQFERPLDPGQRAPWQGATVDGGGSGFDFDAMMAPWLQADGSWPETTSLAMAAGFAFDRIDPVIGEIGNPVGIKSYKPFHSTGEDFLHNYLGMLGIPIDLRPEFPSEDAMILLTESAKFDPDIVAKIKGQLMDGKNVVVTSGLFKALQDKGIRDIVELTVTDRKAGVQDFLIGWFGLHHAESPILIPHIDYLTNDSWEEISGLTNTTGNPFLHSASYANGVLYVLTIPDNFDDLYKLPLEVLERIRELLLRHLYVRVDGPAQVMLFAYDNDTFIVESILPEAAEVRIVTDSTVTALRDVLTGDVLDEAEEILDWRKQSTGEHSFTATLKPHAYRVFRFGA
ncbi:MAG: hypothetical protein JXR84_23815 [Anaerolineae bacterium]|nr:hypothetical protein [Anaerolineae bacterium]